MSVIRLVNEIPGSRTPSAEFRVSQGTSQIARIGVHAGGMAEVPTTPSTAEETSAQQWTVYAIAAGITTETVRITSPNATVTVTANNDDDGFTLSVS